MPAFFDDGRPHDGLDYEAYRRTWKEQTEESPPSGADPSERRMHHYLNYNWERQAHVHDAYTPSDSLQAAVTSIEAPQLIGAPACGRPPHSAPGRQSGRYGSVPDLRQP